MDGPDQLSFIAPPEPKRISGHFSALVTHTGTAFVSTTITTQKKSHARAKESARKAQLLAEIEKLTGAPAKAHAVRFDNIVRRWGGVKANKGDE